jgi:hypothetical protein
MSQPLVLAITLTPALSRSTGRGSKRIVSSGLHRRKTEE